MHENDLSMFKLSKPSQFSRLPALNLNISVERPIEKNEKMEQKESQPKCKKKKTREVPPPSFNNENTIIFQLGSGISKKKCVDAVKINESTQEKGPYIQKPSNPELCVDSHGASGEIRLLEKCSSIEDIKSIYQSILHTSMEIDESRQALSKEVSKMITDMSHFKESLVDYWIELTLTQAKSVNNNSDNNSDADTVLNQILTKQE
ncbi:hypothetical protein OJ253_1667 [Cryptosporidium canis]|uniref:Uncharacterized protein n=1 Tax=Cryptosporidium canis TaxID=195482 RepID=A0A9D5DIV7_9CRYT|nr:hypothetical protein OJ253_1667 [Cryptosporidium canis]